MTRAPHPTRFEDAGTSDADQSATRLPDRGRARTTAVRVVRELDGSSWASFVRRHPDASIFHTPEMHRVFERARGHVPSVWAALDERGEIRALLTSVSIATLGGPLRSATARNVSFAGPLADAAG